MNTSQRWPRAGMVIHWLSALLVGGLVVAGFVMSDLGAADPLRAWLSRGHTVGGLLLVSLTLVRVLRRRGGAVPADDLAVSPLHARGIRAVHGAIYAVMVLLGVSGLATARGSSHWHEYLLGDVPTAPDMAGVAARNGHEVLVFLLLALVVAHVAGVVIHEVRKGGALRRMVPFAR